MLDFGEFDLPADRLDAMIEEHDMDKTGRLNYTEFVQVARDDAPPLPLTVPPPTAYGPAPPPFLKCTAYAGSCRQ